MPEDLDSSPEEKLLRVIRSGGKPDASEEKAAGSVGAVEQPRQASEPALKLKPAEASEPAEPPTAGVEPIAEPATAATVAAAGEPVAAAEPESPTSDAAPSKPSAPAVLPSRPGQWSGTVGSHWLSGVSRGLVAVTVLLLAFAVWDAWGYFTDLQSATPVLPSSSGIAPDEAATAVAPDGIPADTGLPPLDDLLGRFRERPLFALAATVEAAPRRTEAQAAPRSDWERYAGTHLKLLGLSVVDAETGLVEAIVADASTGGMHYLKTDDPLLLDGVRVSVEAVQRDSLILTDGTRRVEIK